MKLKRASELGLIIIILILLARITDNLAAKNIDSKLERENSKIIGADSFYYNIGSNKSILLLHGFAANPYSLIELGNFLSSQGYNVYAPLLPGHGTSAFDMEKYSWEDWQRESENAYLFLENNSEEVYVIGFSMGGDLALNLAKKHDIKKIIIINTPYELKTKFAQFVPLISLVQEYHIKSLFTDEKDIKIIEELKIYKVIPMKSIADILSLISDTKINLDKVNEPILIMQSAKDTLVEPTSSYFIYQDVNSKQKRLIVLKDSTHVKFSDEDKIIIKEELLRELT